MKADLETRAINLRWLLRLRWGAALGQSVVIVLVDRVMGLDLPLAALAALVALELGSNVACVWWARRSRALPEWLLGTLMAFDVLLLTALLQLSGGSFNPFNFLYLVHIALAAVVLPPRWTWGLVALSLGSFASLFFIPGASHLQHGDLMDMHLRGMWVAFAVAALFIVYFVQRIRRALSERDTELALAREHTARGERLAALATLAAGAAHELATPLSTIALAAEEIEGALARGNHEVSEDVRLIASQVRRCRAILDHMSADAGDTPGAAPEPVAVRALVNDALASLVRPHRVDVEVDPSIDERALMVPRRATVQALRGLLDNACDASAVESAVAMRVGHDRGDCRIEVRDSGAGMSHEVLARAGEPFFTTKDPGKGMGLGLFLAHALADRLGGRLELDSMPGRGTVARLMLPFAE
ncbi:MAG TPA: ATP-binding protein [Polyangiaceae bacterium]|jgi:two-component system, sensor histidine kinase RegB|nr:ATP-binding protein [Polyangiaceae bacterium]